MMGPGCRAVPPTHPGYKLSTPPYPSSDLWWSQPSTPLPPPKHTLSFTLTHFQVLRLLSSPGGGRDTVSDPGRQSSRQPKGGSCSEGKGRRLRGGPGGGQTGQQPPASPRRETSPVLGSPRPAPHILPERQAGLGTSHPQASPQGNHAPHLRFTSSSFPTHTVND